MISFSMILSGTTSCLLCCRLQANTPNSKQPELSSMRTLEGFVYMQHDRYRKARKRRKRGW